MKFLKKLCFLLLTSFLFLFLEFFCVQVGQININICNEKCSIGLYAIVSAIFFMLFVYKTLQHIFSFINTIFLCDKKAEEQKSIRNIANLILSNDYEFKTQINKLKIQNNFNIIKTALILKRIPDDKRLIEKTGLKYIDIHIIKHNLKDKLNKFEIQDALKLADEVISQYSEYCPIVQDELLAVAKIARENNLKFSFNPQKFKYNLSQKFSEKFFEITKLIDCKKETDISKKCNNLEKFLRRYPWNNDALNLYFDTIQKDIDKKIKFLQSIFKAYPNRVFSNLIVKSARKDAFEISQQIAKYAPEDNKEKILFLFDVAISSGHKQKANEIFKKLVQVEDITKIFMLYISKSDILDNDQEFVKMLRENYGTKD